MEKLKAKHDHTLTDILKVLIFAIVLLIPGFMFLPSMLYFGFNEQANAPVKQWEITEPVEVDFNQYIQNGNFNNGTNGYNPVRCAISLNNNVLEVNGNGDNFYCEYAFSSIQSHVYIARAYIETDTTQNNFRFYAYYDNLTSYVTTNVVNNELTQYDLRFVPTQNSNNGLMRVIGVSLSTGNKFYMANFQLFDLTQMFGIGKEPTNIDFENYFQSTYYDYTTSELKIIDETIETETVVNITTQLEYNWEQIWQKPLLSWTNTTILKNGLDNFTQVFGITNTSYITNLIAYELIMVAIYIVIDIVLAMFKWLTHLIGTK